MARRTKAPKLDSHAKALKRVTRDFNALAKAVETAGDKGPIMRLSQVGVHMIRQRTVKGGGVQGELRGYSDSYAKYRRRRGMQTAPTNYHHSGKLMEAIAYDIKSPLRSVLFVRKLTAPGSRVPRNEIAKHLQARSEWFGFTAAEKKRLSKEAKRLLTQMTLDTITDSRPVGSDASTLRGAYRVTRVNYPTPVPYRRGKRNRSEASS